MDTLFSISPIDGRYHKKTLDLNIFFLRILLILNIDF